MEGLGQDVVADKDAHVAKLQADGRKVAVTDAQHPVRGAQLSIAIGIAQSAEAQARSAFHLETDIRLRTARLCDPR